MYQEIITLDGRQYNLNSDSPLSVEQKAQTIAEIRRQVLSNFGIDGIDGMQSLAPICNTNKKYYGLQYTSGVTGPGILKLESTPQQGTAPYTTVDFYKDAGATAMTGTVQSVPGITWQNWYVPQLTDVTTGTPVGSHTFTVKVQDSCTGNPIVTEIPCTVMIVDLGVVNANPTSLVMSAGGQANVSLNYLDTVGAAYPTSFTGSSTQLLAQTPTFGGTLASYLSVTNWTNNLVVPSSPVTINLAAGAPAGATGTVTLPVKVSTSTTTKNSNTINITSCSAPVCNFSVS